MESLSEEDMRAQVADRFGAKAGPIIDAYRRAHPKAKPVEILSLISSPRTNAVKQAERKAAQNAAPAYVYWFGWKTPVLDGRPRAFHCSELAFVFYNTDLCAQSTGGGPEARELAGRISDAWIHFARNGDPNHAGLPKWPAFTAAKGETMILDTKCEVKDDPDRRERRVLEG
jgi:para-nitrobenzyl esterase